MLCAIAPATAESDLFYFSDGRRIALERSTRHIGVRLWPEQSGEPLTGLPSLVVSGSVRELIQHRIRLLDLRPGASSTDALSVMAQLEGSPGIELVVDVFETPSALMIVTDRFIARLASGVSDPEIASLNAVHGVEEVGRARWDDRVLFLEVRKGTALATANDYQSLPQIEYAHPDFIRVVPRRAKPDEFLESGAMIGPDGVLLPFDPERARAIGAVAATAPGSPVRPGGLTLGSPAPAPVVPVTGGEVKNETFEGAFPGGWAVSGIPAWDDVAYNPFAGARSGYGVGSSVSPPGPYPDNVNTWMVWGPFDLTGAVDFRVTVQTWIRTHWDGGSVHDDFWIAYSTNNIDWLGWAWWGNWAGPTNSYMNIARYMQYLADEPQVWIALIFQSNGDGQVAEGVYVDDVVIEKITGGHESLTSDEIDHMQWGLSNNGQCWGTPEADISAVEAWTTASSAPATEVVIAVIDEGVDLTHPDLAAKLLPGYDATDDGTSSGGPSGDDAHGTNCAGIAAGVTDNAIGIAGVARGTDFKILPVRIAYGNSNGDWVTTDSRIADGIGWATTHGADVLSNSWGGGDPATVITSAIDTARSTGRGGLGSVVVFSTGNGNDPVHYPATLPQVISVGASSPCDERKSPTSCDGEYWWGSSYGYPLDLVAPGVRNPTTDIQGAAGNSSDDYYWRFNGTSSATPFVAGVAALLVHQDPTASLERIEARLTYAADDIEAFGSDMDTGFGRLNAGASLMVIPDCRGSIGPGTLGVNAMFEACISALTVTGLTVPDDKRLVLAGESIAVEGTTNFGGEVVIVNYP